MSSEIQRIPISLLYPRSAFFPSASLWSEPVFASSVVPLHTTPPLIKPFLFSCLSTFLLYFNTKIVDQPTATYLLLKPHPYGSKSRFNNCLSRPIFHGSRPTWLLFLLLTPSSWIEAGFSGSPAQISHSKHRLCADHLHTSAKAGRSTLRLTGSSKSRGRPSISILSQSLVSNATLSLCR
jgi:hypothetical protein